MKILLIILLTSTLLYSYFLDDKLPKEAMQLVESFDCFTKDDKTLIYTYLLALKYRMEHVNERDALVKSDLEYWRLWHIVSDIQYKYALNYQFDNILEETVTPTIEEKKILKRLRRLESSIRTDGSSESSERMRQYDKKLREKIILSPPKYKILKKDTYLNDYNLSILKNDPDMSISKDIYDELEKRNLKGVKKDLLFRYVWLQEEKRRKYDKPNKRRNIEQELIYLAKCQEYHQNYLQMPYKGNFIRKLADRVSSSTNFYPSLKREFLPKDIEEYCENNITKTKVTTFIPKKDKKKKIKKKKLDIKLESLTTFLKQYDTDSKKKKYAKEYLTLMKQELYKNSTPTPSLESLKLLRLKNCLVQGNDKDDFALIMARVKDFRLEGIKERFYSNIFNSQRWWNTTIRLKMDSEGKSKEMKQFFDCSKVYEKELLGSIGQTNPIKPMNKSEHENRKRARELKQKIRMAGDQKRELLKYYCGTFDGKSTANLNNEKAIKSGMIPKKFLSKDNVLTPLIGKQLIIEGMPKGGMKLIYKELEKGGECEGILDFINMDETIYFGGKSYAGLDYVTINVTKIMLDNFSTEYVKTLCNKQALNDVSFVMEKSVSKLKYNQTKPAVSLYGNTLKRKINIKMPRFPKVNNTHNESPAFFLVDRKAYMISKEDGSIHTYEVHPDLDHKSRVVLSRDGNLIATYSLQQIFLYDREDNHMLKISIPKGHNPKLFLNDNTTLALFYEKKIIFLDLISGNIISELQPKFIEPNKKYFTPRLETIIATKNSEELYIISDKGEVEYWKFKGKKKALSFEYKDKFETNGELISTLLLNPYNEDKLIYSTHKGKIYIVDRKTGKVNITLNADRRMMTKSIDISRDQKYLMAYDHHFIYLWSLENGELIDVIGSKNSKLYSAMFAQGSPTKIIRVATEMEVWSIQKK